MVDWDPERQVMTIGLSLYFCSVPVWFLNPLIGILMALMM
jgi:hypothetical protein